MCLRDGNNYCYGGSVADYRLDEYNFYLYLMLLLNYNIHMYILVYNINAQTGFQVLCEQHINHHHRHRNRHRRRRAHCRQLWLRWVYAAEVVH